MKSKKHKPEARVATAAPLRPQNWGALVWTGMAAAALIAAFVAYWPAIRGAFVLDDYALPFTAIEFENAPLLHWVTGTRPVLMLSFWANYVSSGLEPMSYHVTNVLLHFVAAAFVLLSSRCILGAAGESGRRRDLLAAFAGAIFLLHPLQTESVAYVASRSEVLSIPLFYAAFTVFVYSKTGGIGWLRTLAVVALFGAAVTTKEHTAVLPALLLLTDYYWNPPFSLAGIRKNWRLYGLMAAGAAGASMWVLRILRQSDTAGMNLAEVNWYEYFLTQCRVIWMYVRLFLFPVGLNVDHDVAFSRGLFDGGAVFGLLALLGVIAAAIIYRKRYPLASYGALMFLLLLAPTSSFVPILDPAAERRVYLAMPGLIFVLLELVRRVAWRKEAAWVCAGVCAVFLIATNVRAQAWAGPLPLWQDAVAKSPRKYRPRFQLAYAHYSEGRCAEALRHFEVAGEVARSPQYNLYLDWALAYDCAGNPDKAIEKLQQALRLTPNAHVYAVMGMVYGKQGKTNEALAALDHSTALDPAFQEAWVYRGSTLGSIGQFDKAAEAYRRALALKPDDADTRQKLAFVEAQLRGK